jgi:hypothetical protein
VTSYVTDIDLDTTGRQAKFENSPTVDAMESLFLDSEMKRSCSCSGTARFFVKETTILFGELLAL